MKCYSKMGGWCAYELGQDHVTIGLMDKDVAFAVPIPIGEFSPGEALSALGPIVDHLRSNGVEPLNPYTISNKRLHEALSKACSLSFMDRLLFAFTGNLGDVVPGIFDAMSNGTRSKS